MSEQRVGIVLVFHRDIDKEKAQQIMDKINTTYDAFAASYMREFQHQPPVGLVHDFLDVIRDDTR